MKSRINRAAALGLFVALGMVAMLPTTTLAESACKGRGSTACGGDADCMWVEGYKRKDGKQVSSYCRSASKNSASESDTKKKDAKTSSVKKKDEKK